ncbi:MAG: group I intron-associated PD-(D/E)XK endonuclease [Terriglobales bacterium]
MGKPRRATRGRTPASEESHAQQTSQHNGSARPKEGEQGELAFLSKASSLGFALSLPYGHMQRYDFVVDSGKNLWRVQVKTTEHMLNGLYLVGIHHRANRRAHAYTESEIDFVAVYILPEKTWYILPVREVTEHRSLLFRPKGYTRRDPYAHYREAWHLLRQPDGLVFG